MSVRRVVVVGYGMAGARLADEIRRHDPRAERVALTVIGAEPHPAYNRVLLSHVVAGSMSAQDVLLHQPGWAEQHGVHLVRGTRVTRIDRERRCVVLQDGRTVPYDSLVLATGSRAWIPPVEGLCTDDGAPADGVAVFRTLDDCERILCSVRPGAPVAVLGGGLLGLETARGLVGRGHPVTVVHPESHLMERQLDPPAGRILARVLGGFGIGFRIGQTAVRHVPGWGLELDDGSLVPAGLVVVSAGVRAETGLAAAAGLAVDRGILVDDALRTSDPWIHALGDCAQHPGTAPGLVQPAWEQAAVLAARLTGADPEATYSGTPVVTRLKARDVDLTALGETHVEPDDPSAEVLRLEDPARGRYAKLVLRGERITGAVLLGLPDAAATVTQYYDQGTPAPSDRLALLLGRALPPSGPSSDTSGVAGLPEDTLICRCNTVSKGQLVAAWQDGAHTVPALTARTRATTGCGGCRDTVCVLAAWLEERGVSTGTDADTAPTRADTPFPAHRHPAQSGVKA